MTVLEPIPENPTWADFEREVIRSFDETTRKIRESRERHLASRLRLSEMSEDEILEALEAKRRELQPTRLELIAARLPTYPG